MVGRALVNLANRFRAGELEIRDHFFSELTVLANTQMDVSSIIAHA
jgi:hypothetical protein